MIPWSSLASSTWMFFFYTYDWAIAILIGPVNLIFYCKILCSYSILSFQDFSRINIIFFFFLCCLIWFCLSISQDMTSSCNKLVSPLFSGHILLTVLKVLLIMATMQFDDFLMFFYFVLYVRSNLDFIYFQDLFSWQFWKFFWWRQRR